MQSLVERVVGGLQVEEHLTSLSIGDVVGGLHLVQRLEPLPDLFFSFEIRRKEAEATEAVGEVLDVTKQLVHGPDIEPELVHGSDEQSDRVSDQLARVALVILEQI